METSWDCRTLSGRSDLALDEDLRLEASREGFGFIDRLVEDWRDGVNRFDGSDEVFLGVFIDGGMVAVGGLNRDKASEDVGRLRHVYVRRAFRGRGVASSLLDRLEHGARGVFHTIRLRTNTVQAARLYLGRGYQAVDCEMATHVLRLSGRD